MIIFGTSKNIPINDMTIKAIEEGKMKIFNLCSPSESGERIFSLIPPFNVDMYFDPEKEKNFDMVYCDYILNNDIPFMDLMKIMYSEYELTPEVSINYIMIDFDDVRIAIVESLIKFIQQRYGINPILINTIEDLAYMLPSSFNVTGLYNFDIDKERYANLLNDKGSIGYD